MSFTVKNPLKITRLVTLLGLGLLVSACSHDRYLFLDRADLEPIGQRQAEQQQRLDALESRMLEQFELLETRQQLRQQGVVEQLNQQRDLIRALPRQQASLLPPAQNTTAVPSARFKDKLIVGEVEAIYLVEQDLVYTARIDSGATTSSLHATNIQRFERDGQPWVRFDVSIPGQDEARTLEHEISRRARIIQSNTEDPERRIVVELPFMIGDHRDTAEFTLSDRGHLTYPVLVGRNILRDVMLIDVGQEFTTELPAGLGSEQGATTP